MKEYNEFYFSKLPEFVNILKEKLIDRLDRNVDLTVEDYIKVFFEYYRLNNVSDYFKFYGATEHEMYLSLTSKVENRVYLERSFWIEDSDEQYQIRFTLNIDIPMRAYTDITFEVERDKNGKFHHWEEGYFDFEVYQEKVLTAKEMLDYLKLRPKSMSIEVNADI